MYSRKELVNIIKPWAQKHPSIIAAWEGGSAATNRMDQYSDLDLSLIVNDNQVETVFTDFEVFLKENFSIINKYRIPEPAWHGLSQCFYEIEPVDPFIYLDIAVIKESQPDKLMEQDRHGIATVWFDRKQIYNSRFSTPEEIAERGKKLYQSVVQTDFLIITEVEKGIARGEFIDVFPTYYSFISRHLGVMMNLKHRPEKADFGLRYARIDYSNLDKDILEKGLRVSDIDELAKQFVVIKSRYKELKDELSTTWRTI